MQKYHRGDHVKIAKDLGETMSHFEANCEAIVLYSYKDEYGGKDYDVEDYSVYIKGIGQVSWYEEDQLTLIKKKRLGLLSEWKKEFAIQTKKCAECPNNGTENCKMFTKKVKRKKKIIKKIIGK